MMCIVFISETKLGTFAWKLFLDNLVIHVHVYFHFSSLPYKEKCGHFHIGVYYNCKYIYMYNSHVSDSEKYFV